jgi:hypothetical protein
MLFSGGFRGSYEIMGKAMEYRRDAAAECRLELGWRCRSAETHPAVFSGMNCFVKGVVSFLSLAI